MTSVDTQRSAGMKKEITINRSDYPPPTGECDHFNDLLISLGLASDYTKAQIYDYVDIVCESAYAGEIPF